MKDLGDWLRKHRESKGLSLEEVCHRTKIRLRYLQAIEEGNYELIPEEVYLKGFLRSYADAVGLDKEEVIQRYEVLKKLLPEKRFRDPLRPFLTDEGRPGKYSEISFYWGRAVSALVVAALLFGILVLYQRGLHDGGAPPISESVPPAASAPGEGPQPVVEVKPLDGGSTEIAGAAPLGPSGTGMSSASGRPAGELPEGEQEALVLEVFADQRCWIEAYADGNRVFYRVLEQGESLRLAARRELRLKFGYAQGVRLNLNGRDIGRPGVGVVSKVFERGER